MLNKAAKIADSKFNFCLSKEVGSRRLSFVNSSKNLYQNTKIEQFKVLPGRCQSFIDSLEGKMQSFDNIDEAKYCCCTMYVVTRTRNLSEDSSSNALITRNRGNRPTQVQITI